MQLIAPDFTRRIDLPGVGPCPRPVDIDQSVTGFSDLVSLRIYTFSGTSAINGEAESDEVLIVLLGGGATIRVTGANEADFSLSVDGIRAIYLPPDHHYQLTPRGKADVAYMRARPANVRPPEAFEGPQLVVEDYADRLQLRLVPLAKAATTVTTSAGVDTERLAFVTEAATAGNTRIDAWHTVALGRGETNSLVGDGEALIVAAR